MAGDEIFTPKPANQPKGNAAVDSKSDILGLKASDISRNKCVPLTRAFSDMGVDMVDIFVGQAQFHFRVHKDLLCSHVPYFKAMFNSGFMESQTQSAEFPEDVATTVALFIEWLYAMRLRLADYTKSTLTSGSIWDRILLYSFAEKLCLPDLRDYLMSNLVTAYRIIDRLPSS